MIMNNQPGVIRILLVDDHKNVRNALHAYLDTYDDLHVVGEASDGQEAIKLCHDIQPQVVLIDLNLSGMDGITTTQMIKKDCASTQVIILTNYGEADIQNAAVRAGAATYLSKDHVIDSLYKAIQSVVR
jgi:two-component system, NarL family, response regulator LiaR